MEPTLDARVERLERALRRWRWVALVSLGLAALAWVAGPGHRVVEAQAPKVHRGGAEARPHMEYNQAEAAYTKMAEVIGEWEGKGWETFQIVPVESANPGAGGPMKVAMVFRRLTK